MEAEKIEIPLGSEKPPMCFLVIGMAGSGKTTFIKQLDYQIKNLPENKAPVIINLDPAVSNLNYDAFIDIRNKIKIKEVMKNYNLGPNGAILTSLNIFSSQFDQVLSALEEQKKNSDTFIVDTPGQIEVFSWSASGTIISQMLSLSYPTALVYVVDLSRCQNPNTFMSNMLFCCSILFKMRLPMIVVFNKTDVTDPETVKNWLKDYEAYTTDLRKNESYLSSLSQSLSLVLDEFYNDLNACYLSSLNGDGFAGFFKAAERAREEYYTIFLPDLEKRMQANPMEKKRVQDEIEKFKDQLEKDKVNPNKMNIEKDGLNSAGLESIFQKNKKDAMSEVKKKFEEMKIEEEVPK